MRLIYSILKELSEFNYLINEDYYRLKKYQFKELIEELMKKNFIQGAKFSKDDYYLNEVTLTDKGFEMLKEHDFLKNEYPTRNELPFWVRKE